MFGIISVKHNIVTDRGSQARTSITAALERGGYEGSKMLRDAFKVGGKDFNYDCLLYWHVLDEDADHESFQMLQRPAVRKSVDDLGDLLRYGDTNYVRRYFSNLF